MFPQGHPFQQIYSGEVATYFYDIDSFMPTMHDDHVLMGDMYDFLACEGNTIFGQYFPDLFGHPPLYEDAYPTVNLLCPTPGYAGYASSSSDTTNDLLSPMPTSQSSSRASPSREHRQSSPEPSPTLKPSCSKASPAFNNIRKKWCCSVCNRDFRGKWECRRHIKATDKRAWCLGCGANLKARGDSLLRHFRTYCKGDVGNLRLEDAFVEA